MFKKFAKKDHKKETAQLVKVADVKSSKDIDEVIEIPDDINTRAGVHKDKSMQAMFVVDTSGNIKNNFYVKNGRKQQVYNDIEI